MKNCRYVKLRADCCGHLFCLSVYVGSNMKKRLPQGYFLATSTDAAQELSTIPYSTRFDSAGAESVS